MQYRANYREIDLDALRHNVRQLRKATAKDARLMAVVKSDAYGHGMVQVARAALSAGAEALAAALVEEGEPSGRRAWMRLSWCWAPPVRERRREAWRWG